MENGNNNGNFSYTYSASEQEELKKLREKYAPRTDDEDKMERLRRLDARVTQKAQVWSLVFGVIGALLLGLGMSFIMTDLGASLSVGAAMAIGISVGTVGGILAALAYPVYLSVTKREREKIAPEILRLTDELMK